MTAINRKMQALLNSVGLGGLVPNRVNVPAAAVAANNMRNNARNNARRRLNFGAQHPPGNEPEMVEEDIAITPNGVNVAMEAVETVSPPGNSPTVGGRRKSRKASRKANRKASRKANRKASRKANRRN